MSAEIGIFKRQLMPYIPNQSPTPHYTFGPLSSGMSVATGIVTHPKDHNARKDRARKHQRLVKKPNNRPAYRQPRSAVTKVDSLAVGHPSSSENWAQSEVLRLSKSFSSI